jgi:hypothetical protein
MARMLRDNESTGKHLNAGRRHTRLCKKLKGAEKYALNMETVFSQLIVKKKATDEKTDAREDFYDDMILYDTDLDNSIRTSFEKCKQFDRENPGQAVLNKIFPEGKFTVITNIERTKEPDAAEQLAVRFESLGSDHPLYETAAVLREKISASREAINAYYESIREHKLAQAEEEIAQAAFRRQYEANYLDARKEFGKVLAERLFPRITGRSAAEEMAETEETTMTI